MVMTMMTTKSSMRVNASSAHNVEYRRSVEGMTESQMSKKSRQAGFFIRMSALRRSRLRLLVQPLDDCDQRHEKGDDDRANDEGETNNHDRFQRCSDAGHRVIDFLIVNLSNLQKHFG